MFLFYLISNCKKRKYQEYQTKRQFIIECGDDAHCIDAVIMTMVLGKGRYMPQRHW